MEVREEGESPLLSTPLRLIVFAVHSSFANGAQMRVLIVEDDRKAAETLAKALGDAGYQTEIAEDGEKGFELASSSVYRVLIIDRMLPNLDGLSLVERLRARGDRTPVLIISALGAVDDRVRGLRSGGDDYLPKPYSLGELVARVEALTRRNQSEGAVTTYSVGDLVLDRLAHKVTRGGETIILQPREYRLLEYLIRHAGQVVTRKMLLENVWDYHFDPQTNVIDVHISRLRSKIDKGQSRPLLETVRGAGYMIRDDRR
jgi:two-component system, OmpR family, response regulator